MHENLKEMAVINLRKKKAKKRSVHTVGVIFIAISILLFTISLNAYGPDRSWIKFPILILALVYAVIYFSAFGFPFIGGSEDISQEEIEREMVKIFKLQGKTISSDEAIEELELKEIESLKNRWEDDEEYV